MPIPRFFCQDLNTEEPSLGESESHHAFRVLRLSAGQEVELFDGRGGVADGTISEATRRSVTVRITGRHPQVPRGKPEVIVAAAPPKGDRFKQMLEKLTEIGISRFIPLKTGRSVVEPRPQRLDRLDATVMSAARQSRQAWLPVIDPVTDLAAVLRHAVECSDRIWLAHPGSSGVARVDRRTTLRSAERDLVLIGPEGGFTSEEVVLISDHGARRLMWPHGILRIETAAVVFAALLLAGAADAPSVSGGSAG